MNEQEAQIIQLSPTRFQVGYPATGQTPLTIDFARVLAAARSQFPIAQSLLLKHWQARPTGQRRWGVYCWSADRGSYHSYWPFQIRQTTANHVEIQVSDDGPPPTAVLCYPNAKLIRENGHPIIWKIEESEYE